MVFYSPAETQRPRRNKKLRLGLRHWRAETAVVKAEFKFEDEILATKERKERRERRERSGLKIKSDVPFVIFASSCGQYLAKEKFENLEFLS